MFLVSLYLSLSLTPSLQNSLSLSTSRLSLSLHLYLSIHYLPSVSLSLRLTLSLSPSLSLSLSFFISPPLSLFLSLPLPLCAYIPHSILMTPYFIKNRVFSVYWHSYVVLATITVTACHVCYIYQLNVLVTSQPLYASRLSVFSPKGANSQDYRLTILQCATHKHRGGCGILRLLSQLVT